MKLAQDFGKSREETLIWLEQMLAVIRKMMIDEVNSVKKNGSNRSFYYLDVIRNVQKTHTIIKTSNVNQRFALENLFLSL